MTPQSLNTHDRTTRDLRLVDSEIDLFLLSLYYVDELRMLTFQPMMD